MFISYDWVKEYLADAPSLEEAARILNQTGLEAEIDDGGLEIEHTVNRPDAMCHFGVARELAVKLDLKLLDPPVYEDALPELPGWEIESMDAAECPQYIGVKVDGLKHQPSPPWLARRLEEIGQTSHGLVVDLTNFLLWEMGHPSHAFDADLIRGKKILIREGRKGERLTTLDGRAHDAAGLLCIADIERPIAFAGVMGGENTEVSDKTANLLLELACFRSATVRRTGKSCNIESDARHRFERGVDRERMERVIRRFLYLLRREQPEVRIVGMRNMDLQPFQRCEIAVRRSQLDRLLGIRLPDDRVTALLQAMDCRPVAQGSGWRLSVPGYKVDVQREVDVIEEIIRFAGLDLLHAALPEFGGSDYKVGSLLEKERVLRQLLKSLGLQEAYCYSFSPEEWDRAFLPEGEPVCLRNPMSGNQAVMRRLLLPNLLDCVRRNLNRGIADVGLFEIGHVFADGEEPHHVAIVLAQSKEKEHWWDVPNSHPFYRIKGIFESLDNRLGWQELRLGAPVPAYFNDREALGFHIGGRCIGGLGTLAPALLESWGIDTPLAALEIDLSQCGSLVRQTPVIEELSPYPAIQMDMAFVLDRRHPYRDVQEFVIGLKPDYLEALTLFDAYEGKSVGAGKKSLGFRFKFRSANDTLTGEAVSQIMDRIVESVKDRFGAMIRT